MNQLKKTISLWEPGQIKMFAQEILDKHGKGWAMMSLLAREDAIKAKVTGVLCKQARKTGYTVPQICDLFMDIYAQMVEADQI